MYFSLKGNISLTVISDIFVLRTLQGNQLFSSVAKCGDPLHLKFILYLSEGLLGLHVLLQSTVIDLGVYGLSYGHSL